jgi:hypothetical protein
MWLCYGYLKDLVMLWYLREVVMLWVFKGCGYVIGIERMWLCYGYLRDVVMLCVFKRYGYIMGTTSLKYP